MFNCKLLINSVVIGLDDFNGRLMILKVKLVF